MKPYYNHAGITIYHGDCREIMPDLDLVDSVIEDTTYGDTFCEWDRVVTGWADLCPLTPGGTVWCFGSFRYWREHGNAEFSGWKYAQDVVWEKHNGSNFHADRFRRVHELVAQFYKGLWGDVYRETQKTNDATERRVRRKQRPAHFGNAGASSYRSKDGGPRLMRSVIFVRSCHGSAENETQKPEGIIAPLVLYSCPPGGVVLDPFVGSGTTLAVAKAHGRRAIGIELRESQCEIAAKRMAQEVLL